MAHPSRFSENSCHFNLQGSEGFGYAYITNGPNTLGLDFLNQSAKMAHHLKKMVSTVESSTSRSEISGELEASLRQKFPEVFAEGLGRCVKEKAELKLKPD